MRILPPVLFAIFVLLMVALRTLMPGPIIISAPYHWFGAVLVAIGASITILAGRQFHRLRTNIKTFDEPTLLVTDGLFRWTRNPMYLGFVTALFGFALFFGALAQIILAVLFLVITASWYIPFEERAMRRKFGQAYADYVSRTRRWI